MNYKQFTVNPIQENCYVLWDEESHDGALIDCGARKESEWNGIAEHINKENIRLKYVLQTHCHFDHIWGLGYVHEYCGLLPKCHIKEIDTYNSAHLMVEKWFRTTMPDNMPRLDATLTEGTVLTLGKTGIQVIHTPGHTPGGVCFYVPDARLLFSGDTLFRMSLGRTDFEGGSYHDIVESITDKLFLLPEDTKVLPGHGPDTTIGEEKDMNPYLK